MYFFKIWEMKCSWYNIGVNNPKEGPIYEFYINNNLASGIEEHVR